MITMNQLHQDAVLIYQAAIAENLPDKAVSEYLRTHAFSERLFLLAIGKAAWRMARAAYEVLGKQIYKGMVITKYGHNEGAIEHCTIFEAGHPISDQASINATTAAIQLLNETEDGDRVLFLISGGGSALYEAPIPGCTLKDLQEVQRQLIASGADITEINAIRKRLSLVKGGKSAALCAPARVTALVLSDVVGNPLDVIASGPLTADLTTEAKVKAILKKYPIVLKEELREQLFQPQPPIITEVDTHIIGDLNKLLKSAASKAKALGYQTNWIQEPLIGDVSEATEHIWSHYQPQDKPTAWLFGGEPTVVIKGQGKGGRNQELALRMAFRLAACKEPLLFFSIGSDGTDGPTDAAGGYVTSQTIEKLKQHGIDVDAMLQDNDSYTALKAIDQLIITGPTGTNVNDLMCLLQGRR